MDTQIIAQRITGRDALARILAAIDSGAPSPDSVTSLHAGAQVHYHRNAGRRDPRTDAAAMVRALDIAAEPRTNQFDGYHTVVWESWQYDPVSRWSVTAYVTDEPEQVQS